MTMKPSNCTCRALNVGNLAMRKCWLHPRLGYVVMSDTNKSPKFILFIGLGDLTACKMKAPRKVVRNGHRILRKRLTSGKKGEFQWGLFEDCVSKARSACSDRFSGDRRLLVPQVEIISVWLHGQGTKKDCKVCL